MRARHFALPGERCTALGSSPRMRGIPPDRDRGARYQRFIPAHAGNSFDDRAPAMHRSVHPRACGEFVNAGDDGPHRDGSSPRMRGIHGDHPRSRAAERFIPAHAGNSLPGIPTPANLPVHPRACGEFIHVLGQGVGAAGSSPRMRGILRRMQRRTPSLRFIPAHAGNSAQRYGSDRGTPVHPRACGEFRDIITGLRAAGGSSPRMRGIRGFG